MKRSNFISLLLTVPFLAFVKACNINEIKTNKEVQMSVSGKTSNSFEISYEVRRSDGSLKEKRVEKIENGKTVNLKSDIFDEDGNFIKSKEN